MSRSAVSCEHFASFAHFDEGELALEAVEESVEDCALAFVERGCRMRLPEARLLHHCAENRLHAVEGPIETGQEPPQPRGDVEGRSTGTRRIGRGNVNTAASWQPPGRGTFASASQSRGEDDAAPGSEVRQKEADSVRPPADRPTSGATCQDRRLGASGGGAVRPLRSALLC